MSYGYITDPESSFGASFYDDEGRELSDKERSWAERMCVGMTPQQRAEFMESLRIRDPRALDFSYDPYAQTYAGRDASDIEKDRRANREKMREVAEAMRQPAQPPPPPPKPRPTNRFEAVMEELASELEKP